MITERKARDIAYTHSADRLALDLFAETGDITDETIQAAQDELGSVMTAYENDNASGYTSRDVRDLERLITFLENGMSCLESPPATDTVDGVPQSLLAALDAWMDGTDRSTTLAREWNAWKAGQK